MQKVIDFLWGAVNIFLIVGVHITLGMLTVILEAPKNGYLLIGLVVAGCLLVLAGIKMRRANIKNPATGAGSVAGNGIVQLVAFLIAWLGCMTLVNAITLTWSIFK